MLAVDIKFIAVVKSLKESQRRKTCALVVTVDRRVTQDEIPYTIEVGSTIAQMLHLIDVGKEVIHIAKCWVFRMNTYITESIEAFPLLIAVQSVSRR